MFRKMLRGAPVVALAATVIVVLSGCSGNGQGGSLTVTTTPGADAVEIVIGAHDVYFDPAEITAPAGRVELELVERGSQVHTLVFEDIDDFKLSVTKGDKEDAKAIDLEPGTYTYYCDIPGHRGQGMEGTLVTT